MAESKAPSSTTDTPASGFFALVVGRPVAISMLVLGVMVFGGVSWNLLPINLMPDISYPTLTVRTEVPGAAPEEVERNVTRPIEQQLGVVSGLVEMSSVARAGLSDVVLEFDWDTDMNEASQEVREKLEFVSLPDDAARPLLLRYDPSLDPVMRLALTRAGGDGTSSAADDELALRRIAETSLERHLLAVPGVAAARVRGGLRPELRVELDEGQLTRLGLSIRDVADRIGGENVNVAGGMIEDGDTDYLVRILNEFDSTDEVESLIVGSSGGHPVRVHDAATVTLAHAEQQVRTRVDGAICVNVDIYREADANIVAISEAVRELVFGDERASELPVASTSEGDGESSSSRQATGPLASRLPEGVHLSVATDQARFIRLSIQEVIGAAAWGGIFAAIVLYLFLRNFAQTLVVCLSIPLSVVATFAPLHLFDVSLNLMSLGGLALGIGMLVDNGIVVVESVFRCREEGDDASAAAVRGAREVGGAVTASTMTTVAVFLPIVFVTGIAGQVFGDLALSVVFSLATSLAVALTFVPMLAARLAGAGSEAQERTSFRLLSWPEIRAWTWWRRGSIVRRILGLPPALAFAFMELAAWIIKSALILVVLIVSTVIGIVLALGRALLWAADRSIGRVFGELFGLVERAYPPIVRGALHARAFIILAAAALLTVAVMRVQELPRELIPRVHQGQLLVDASLPVGTPLARTDEVAALLERRLEDVDGVARVSTTVGVERTSATDSDKGEHSIAMTIGLEPSTDPQAHEEAITSRIRDVLATVPNLRTEVHPPVLFSQASPIQVQVLTDDLDTLRRETSVAETALSATDGLTDVRSTVREGNPEVRVLYDRERLATLGLRVQDVAEIVRAKVKGVVATRYRGLRERVDVLVRLDETGRSSVKELERLVVNPGDAVPVRLGAIASIEVGAGPAEIHHVDGSRAAIIHADHVGIPLSTAVERVRDTLDDALTDPSVTYAIVGQQAEVDASQTSLLMALALAVFLVYIVMASQFESVLQPLVILVAVPLAAVGAVVALDLSGIPLSVVVFLGLIVLVGIVVNNAIVLVDRTNALRRRGQPRRDAIVGAARQRLRPILMTTLTTVLGLVPLALSHGEGAEIRVPLAIVIVGGLLSSTLLTLIVIPVMYDLLESAVDAVRGRSDEATATNAPDPGPVSGLAPAGDAT